MGDAERDAEQLRGVHDSPWLGRCG
jgi:hypothetical protein